MRTILIIELIINYIFLIIFNMHMLQLNSYFFLKHFKWMNKNLKKLSMQLFLLVVPAVLVAFNNLFTNIVVILFLIISIIYNFPKKKSKIALKYTSRIKRLLFTEIILLVFILLIGGFNNFLLIKLFAVNIFANMLIVLGNLINYPIEKLNRKRYVNQSKQILSKMPNLLVIGVTGSYGKTSMKNFLYSLLSEKYDVLKTPKNFNTTMGVVKTIREDLKPTHQIFICEMGATNIGDIKEICDIVNPKLGVITSIGPQHLESFKSIENIIKTKFELADSVKQNDGTIFLNYDNEYIKNKQIDMKKITYGIDDNKLDYNSYNLRSSSKGLKFNMIDKSTKEETELKTKLIGRHNIENLTGAIAVANYLGIPMKKIIIKLREIKNVKHRLELLNNGNLTIIDDSYNANPISSKSAVDTLGEFEGTKVIVTPGLIELGKDENKYNFELGKYMTNVCDYIFLVGTNHYKPILEGIEDAGYDKEKVFIVASPEEAVQKVISFKINGPVTILLENDLPDNYNL